MERFNTREEWLNAAAKILRDECLPRDMPDWKTPRVSCGFGTSKAALGMCFYRSATKDGVPQIYISPCLDPENPAAPMGVLATLLHELVHACLPDEVGHKKPFARMAEAVGLEGPWTATAAGAELQLRLEVIAQRLGPYPHAAVDLGERKKQSTRMLKLQCPKCGMVIRTTKQWLDDIGSPLCNCSQTYFEGYEGEE